MRRVKSWIKNIPNLLAANKRLKIAILAFIAISLISTSLVGGFVAKNQQGTQTLTPTPVAQQESDSGEVAGVSTGEVGTPTPTPTVTRRAFPTSTPIPTPAPANEQSSSNNNQSNNNSSNNSDQQSQNNTSSQTQAPTPTPTATPTQEPTPTPTPDNSPFEAEWNMSWVDGKVNVTIGANKPIKRCLYDIWGGSISVSGQTNGEGYGCSIGGTGGSSPTPNNKVWVRAESIYGETKDFGDSNPPSQSNVNQ